ncbi:MAG: cytochrome c biogenesis protein CcsA [Rhodospirillales bacterium]
MENVLLNCSALAALLPTSLQAFRRSPAPDGAFWALLALATIGPLAWAAAQATGAWPTGFAGTLWLTVAATMSLYVAVALVMDHAWRLAPLVAAYMLILGFLATIWAGAPAHQLLAGPAEAGWINAHIATALVTYGLVTIAAIAAFATWLQDRALKRKQPSAISRSLPSVRDCERLLVRLLIIGEFVLGLGLATGMALQYRETGALLVLNHKTILTIAAFMLLAGLLAAYGAGGVRGKRAARVVLLGYLLLTLGYPGVKFVTDVLMR